MGGKPDSADMSMGHFRHQYYAVLAGKYCTKKRACGKDSWIRIYCFAVNLISLSHGCMVGWLTPVLPLLKSDDTPLTTGPLSLEDVSWMASIAPMGSVFSALILRWITVRIGSKRMMTNCLAIVSVVRFIVFPHCNLFMKEMTNICCRYAGYSSVSAERNMKFSFRDLCAVSSLPASIRHSFYSWLKFLTIGILPARPFIIFHTHIGNRFHFRIRGKLGSMALLIRSIGYLLAFIVGAYVEYSIVPFIYLGIPILFLAFLLYLPNTAPYLIRTGQYEVRFHWNHMNFGFWFISIAI